MPAFSISRVRLVALAAAALAVAGCAMTSSASAPPPYAPGAQSFADCGDCPEMVVVPAGQFVMGSPDTEKYRASEDQHTVTIARPFAVSKYEITFDQWRACLKDGGCDGYDPDDEGWGRGKRPVIYVDYINAQAYLAWLGKKSGHTYRLLTEAEWEYAARAGSTTPFHFGARLSSEQANFDASTRTDLNPKGANRKKTLPVGSFPPNAFGLHDMLGNASEWVEDCWNDTYSGAPTDGSAWLGGDCRGRVLRGGSWEDSVTDLRVGARVSSFVEEKSSVDTLRVARDLP